MPWIKLIRPEHTCRLPINYRADADIPYREHFEAGSVWQCPDCELIWEYSPYWLDAHRWKKQTQEKGDQ